MRSIAYSLFISFVLIAFGFMMPSMWTNHIASLDPVPLTLYLDPHSNMTISKIFQVIEAGSYGLEITLDNKLPRHLTECLLGIADIRNGFNRGKETCPEAYHDQNLQVTFIINSKRKQCTPPPLSESYSIDFIARPVCDTEAR